MKRILLALAVVLSVQAVNAQVKSPSDAKKAVEAAEAAASDPKKATKVATWLKLAGTYMDAYAAPAGAGWVGAGRQELQLVLGNDKPTSSENVTLAGEAYTKERFKTRDNC